MKPASVTSRALEHRVGENRLYGFQADGAGQRQSEAGRADLSGTMLSTKRSDKKKCHVHMDKCIHNMFKSLHFISTSTLTQTY